MITGNKEIDNIMELAESILSLPDGKPYSEALAKAKVNAVGKTLRLTKFYREQGYMSELVYAIFEKKMKMIQEAGTVKELEEIAKPAKPHYNGNGFTISPFSVPEEEMILWSLTSFNGPLIPEAHQRYMELFEQIFGVDPFHATDETMERYRRGEVKSC